MNKTKDTHETQTTIWEKCLLYIKDRVPDLAFQTWFVGIKLSTVTEEEVVLQVPNKFHYEWLESKYRILIDDAIKNNFKIFMVHFMISLIISNTHRVTVRAGVSYSYYLVFMG